MNNSRPENYKSFLLFIIFTFLITGLSLLAFSIFYVPPESIGQAIGIIALSFFVMGAFDLVWWYLVKGYKEREK